MARCLWGACAAVVLLASVHGLATAQIIYQEGFNDDGDGTRYDIIDRGFEITNDGPGLWGHNFDADELGLGSNAPERRAAILWGPAVFEDQVMPEALEVWSSLVGWATYGKEGATIGFFPGADLSEGDFILSEMLEGMGYAVEDIIDTADLPDPSELDLLIHTNEGTPTPSDEFVDYAVPLISYNAGFHDDNAIAGNGPTLDFFEPVIVNTVPENENHPALGGKTGAIPWTNEAVQLSGIGKIHGGGKLLATVEDPDSGENVPALFVIEKDGLLLGAFEPEAEGDGFIAGAALSKFGGGLDRILDINPIDVTGKSDVRLTVALAATDADFEDTDFLRILIDPTDSGEFELIANFTGNTGKALEDQDTLTDLDGVVLSPTEFVDVTFDIPAGATNLAVRFEAFNTWGNEIVAIDNLRVHIGELPPDGIPGDFDNSGVLDTADIDNLTTQVASATNPATHDLNDDSLVDTSDIEIWIKDLKGSWIGDANLDGEFNTGDLVVVLASGAYEVDVDAAWSTGDFNGDGRANTGDLVVALADGGYEAGPRPAVAAVPEPASSLMSLIGGLLIGLGRRRKR